MDPNSPSPFLCSSLYLYASCECMGNDKRSKGKGEEKKIETSRYYDGVNFARLISSQQKGWFSFGYNDDVVPPTTAWATYNTVTGPKEISPYQATWHFWFQEQWDEWEAWLLRELKNEK